MPVEVMKRCAYCGEMKVAKDAFPSRIVGRAPKTNRPQRVYEMYCRDCLTTYPGLRTLERREMIVRDK